MLYTRGTVQFQRWAKKSGLILSCGGFDFFVLSMFWCLGSDFYLEYVVVFNMSPI
jgi:hypothetical protein